MSIFKFQETEKVYFWNECASNIISLSRGQDGVKCPDCILSLIMFGTTTFNRIREVKNPYWMLNA